MKNYVFERLRRMYDYWRLDRDFYKVVFAFSFTIFCVFWTMYHQITGRIPSVSSLNLFWLHEINLPFGISRLWDILVVPTVFLLIDSYICTSGIFARNNYGELGYWGDVIDYCAMVSCLFALVFGFVYLPLLFPSSLTAFTLLAATAKIFKLKRI